MFQGIKSIWRTRSRCISSIGLASPPRRWRAGIPSSGTTWRFQSRSTELAVEPLGVSTSQADLLPISQMSAEVEDTNFERNRSFRQAFGERSPEHMEKVKLALSSTYAPTIRDYPSPRAMKESKREALKAARVQVAFEKIWKMYGNKVPAWDSTFNLLKRMTTRRNESSSMAAMRIVLPKDWDLALGNQKVVFVDSATGLVSRLRVSGDHQNPSAIILRGKSSVLIKAADELVAKCKGVEVYKLGEVAAFGYEVKRLWPAIEEAPDGGSSVPEDKLDNIWVHEEHHTYWIDTPYEKTPKPKIWTAESFERYITSLVCGRLHPHLVLPFYVQPRKDGKFVDSDGVRIKMILNAFMDPAARLSITPSVLKMAISFIAQKGGHRAEADQLLTRAEEWGMPMDTEVFNIMLESYVAKKDVAFFHKFLLKMEQRYFNPNARTWLLFLDLVQKETERRQVIVGMYDLGLFEDPATRRGIARTMASHDAYVAFRSGKRLSLFMKEQKSRYGGDWFTNDALHNILTEFFRFHGPEHRYFNDFRSLIDKQSEDGRKVGIDAINLILRYSVSSRDWQTAIWALSKMPVFGCEPDPKTYEHVIELAIKTRSPRALGVAFFYGAVERKIRGAARAGMRTLLLGNTLDPFWAENKPQLFSKKMARLLLQRQVIDVRRVVSRVEWAIHQAVGGYKIVKSLAYSLNVAWQKLDRGMHQRKALHAGDDAAAASRGSAGVSAKEESDAPTTVPSATMATDHGIQVLAATDAPTSSSPATEQPPGSDMAIRLRGYDENNQPMKMYVHLDGQFVPRLMVRNWDPEREKETRERLNRRFEERRSTEH